MQAQLHDAIMRVFESEIRLEESQTKKLRENFNEFMRELIPILQEDRSIGVLFDGVQQVGSSATKLRVGSFDEFDVNILLKTTFLQVSGASSSGFIYLWIDEYSASPESHNASRHLQVLRSLMQGSQPREKISPLQLVDQLFSAVTMAVNRLPSHRLDVQRVSRREGSPAITLKVHHDGRSISIDLVPVFQFPWSALPSHCKDLPHVRQYLTRDLMARSSGWTAVPKSAPNDWDKLTWRVHVEDLERAALQNKGLMKDGIRLLKCLRNCEGGKHGECGTWRHLTSQMIKTVFLWEDEKSRGSLWNKDISEVLVTIIGALEGYLRSGALRDFWFNTNYLDFKNISAIHWVNMADRLRRIKNDLEGPDPAWAVAKYFRK